MIGLEYNDFFIYNMVRFGNFLNFPMASMSEIPIIILLGCICGLVGGCWNRICEHIMKLRLNTLHLYKRYKVAEIVVICFLSAGLRILLPLLSNECIKTQEIYNCNEATIYKDMNA